MSRYGNNYGFPKYVSVAERRAKAEKKVRQLRKKNPDIAPVEIQGQKLARSWWGISWNKNLEGYADYTNRIGRGRSYVRHGAVLDLKITPGKIVSLVQGSTSRPYTVEVDIKKITPAAWKKLLEQCRGEMDSLTALVDGRLPKSMDSLLTAPGSGMFPSPKEINFDCSCPDWAAMCKHVAATLYGVGARLDQDPSLFFTLRGVHMEDLVTQAVKDEARDLLARANRKKSRRIIREADISTTFGIDMDDDAGPVASASTPLRRPATRKKTAPASIKKATTRKTKPGKTAITHIPIPGISIPSASKPKTASPVPRKKKSYAKTAPPPAETTTKTSRTKARPQASGPAAGMKSEYDVVVGIVRRRRVKGIGFKEIKARTGIKDTKIRNILFQAKKKNDIRNISRGLYIKGDA